MDDRAITAVDDNAEVSSPSTTRDFFMGMKIAFTGFYRAFSVVFKYPKLRKEQNESLIRIFCILLCVYFGVVACIWIPLHGILWAQSWMLDDVSLREREKWTKYLSPGIFLPGLMTLLPPLALNIIRRFVKYKESPFFHCLGELWSMEKVDKLKLISERRSYREMGSEVKTLPKIALGVMYALLFRICYYFPLFCCGAVFIYVNWKLWKYMFKNQQFSFSQINQPLMAFKILGPFIVFPFILWLFPSVARALLFNIWYWDYWNALVSKTKTSPTKPTSILQILGAVLLGAVSFWIPAQPFVFHAINVHESATGITVQLLDPYFKRLHNTDAKLQKVMDHNALLLGFGIVIAFIFSVPLFGLLTVGYAQGAAAGLMIKLETETDKLDNGDKMA